MMPHAIEITTFRLNAGLTTADFIAANADIDPWLQAQPGFLSRHICEREDGFVIDMLVWASPEAGHLAAAGIMTEMGHSPVHAAIDQATVEWTISTVHHSMATSALTTDQRRGA